MCAGFFLGSLIEAKLTIGISDIVLRKMFGSMLLIIGYRRNKTAVISNSVQFVEQEFPKPVVPSEETVSSLYWANVLNTKTIRMDESENLASNKTKQTKRRIYWWM